VIQPILYAINLRHIYPVLKRLALETNDPGGLFDENPFDLHNLVDLQIRVFNYDSGMNIASFFGDVGMPNMKKIILNLVYRGDYTPEWEKVKSQVEALKKVLLRNLPEDTEKKIRVHRHR